MGAPPCRVKFSPPRSENKGRGLPPSGEVLALFSHNIERVGSDQFSRGTPDKFRVHPKRESYEQT